MSARRLAIACAWLATVSFIGIGIWAFAAPRSFFDSVATYPPYNEHLFHDLGAFLLAIGASLLAGLNERAPLAVGLWGGAVATVLHAVSHWLDKDQGGRSADPYLWTVAAVVVVAGLIASERRARP